MNWRDVAPDLNFSEQRGLKKVQIWKFCFGRYHYTQLFFFHLILLLLFPFLQVFQVVFYQSFCISYGSWVKFNCCKIDQKKVLVKLLQLYHAVTSLVHYFFSFRKMILEIQMWQMKFGTELSKISSLVCSIILVNTNIKLFLWLSFLLSYSGWIYIYR